MPSFTIGSCHSCAYVARSTKGTSTKTPHCTVRPAWDMLMLSGESVMILDIMYVSRPGSQRLLAPALFVLAILDV